MTIIIKFLSIFFTLAIICLVMGCSTASQIGQLPQLENIKNQIDNVNFPIHIPSSVDLTKFDVTQFNTCMAPLSTKLKPGFVGFMSAIKNQNHEVESQFLWQISELDNENRLSGNEDLNPIIEHLYDHLLEIKFDKQITNLDNKLKAITNHTLGKLNNDQVIIKSDAKEAAKHIQEYLLAYFKKGSAQSFNLALQDSNQQQALKSKIASLLKLKADDQKLAKVFELLNPQLVKASDKILKKASGFTARDGTNYSFPGIENKNTHVIIDHSQIGADVVRIIFEALRDTYAPLPVLAKSTPAIRLQNSIAAKHVSVDYSSNIIEFSDSGQLLNVDDKGISTESGQLSWHLYFHNPAIVEEINIDEERFQEIEARGRKAEAFVASAVGKAIRGGSWGSLNNETVAKLVETAAGVIARHSNERAGWCLQAQQSIHKESDQLN